MGCLQTSLGGTTRIRAPARYAYGDHGVPKLIEPGTDLVFDVTLVKIGDRVVDDDPPVVEQLEELPPWLAAIRSVNPSSRATSVAAFAAISCSVRSARPMAAAIIRGVCPSPVEVLGSAPRLRSREAIASVRDEVATIRGVQPSQSVASMSAPASRSSETVSTDPALAA